jgi:acyl carrier protein
MAAHCRPSPGIGTPICQTQSQTGRGDIIPMSSTFEKVASIISQTSDVELEKITPDSHIIKDLEVDSLAFLDIAFEIDQAFKIQKWMEEINQGNVPTDEYFIMKNLCAKIDNLAGAAVG